MKKLNLFVTLFVLTSVLYGQETSGEKPADQPTAGGFFFALGENVLSNTVLHLMNRFWGEPWAQTSPASVWENITGPWEWDRDEYFTNQFGHPYQGSTYHAAAHSNGFNFYQAFLFDAFGSVSWELFAETNAPSINDLISTTLGGAALGEMFHRLYLEIPYPFAVVVSPFDALNNLVTRRHPQRTQNIYSIKLASGIGYAYAERRVLGY
jgi:hypothetical protein